MKIRVSKNIFDNDYVQDLYIAVMVENFLMINLRISGFSPALVQTP